MKLLLDKMDFQKCGEIIVSAKHNIYAMSCIYCQERLPQLQSFIRHLQLQHTDKLEFAKTDKNVEIYAVEELMTTLNQSSVEKAESEESGVAEENDRDWLTEEDHKWLNEGDVGEETENKNGTGLANMSILKALKDCDVSLNFADNLDETNCGEGLDSDKEEDDDDVLNNTLLQQIQKDCDATESSETAQLDQKDAHDLDFSHEFNGDVTMTDICVTSTRNEKNIEGEQDLKDDNNKETLGLKGLLQGLEDLEDVDGLLENLEDSLVDTLQNEISNILNKSENVKIANNGEAPVLEDLDLTVNHKNEDLINESVINYKLAIKNPKDDEKVPITSTACNKNQQKMLINIESGELENVSIDHNQLEDSLEEENYIFNKFINKSIKENEIDTNFKNNKSLENHEPLLENLQTPTNNQAKFEEDDFELQLKNLEEYLENDNLVNKNSLHNEKQSKNSKSQVKNFELQLKNLEETLNENNFDKNKAQILTKNIENSHGAKINLENLSKSSCKKLKSSSNSEIYLNKELSTQNSKDIANNFTQSLENITKNKKKSFQQYKYVQMPHFEEENLNGSENPYETDKKSLFSETLNNDLTKALEEALEDDDLNLLNMEDETDNEPPLNQNLKDLLALELLDDEIEMPTNSNTNKIDKGLGVNLKQHEDKAIANNVTSLSRYDKTNLKAKIMRQNPLNGNKNLTQKILQPNKKHLIKKIPLKVSNDKENPLKYNHEVNMKQQQTSFTLKAKTPRKLPENQENFVLRPEKENSLKSNQDKIMKQQQNPKTPKKLTENQENFVLQPSKAINEKENLLKYNQEINMKQQQNIKTPENQENFVLRSLKTSNEKENPLKYNKEINMKQQQNSNILKSKTPKKSLENQENFVLQTLKTSNDKQNLLKCNQEVNMKQQQPFILKSKTPKKSLENQENFVLQTLKTSNEKQNPLKYNQEVNMKQQQNPKTPKKSLENQENFVLRTRQGKPSIKENIENFTPDFIKKIKKEKFTPHQSFINTERGDRTPLKKDELFLKQSPKTQEKQQDIEENFTPKRGERTPKSKEKMFLQQSPKTQEKNEEYLHLRMSTRGNKTPKRQEQFILKQSPKTQEKNEFNAKYKMVKTPGKINSSPKIDEALKKECKLNLNKKSPPKSSKQNDHLVPLTTPQRVRNLAIKLPRLTPNKLQQNGVNDKNRQLQFLKSPQSSINVKENITNANNNEHQVTKKVFNDFKLPKGITMTKISPSSSKHNLKSSIKQTNLDETPIKTNYCKQNFSESSLQEPLQQQEQQHDIQLTLIKPQNQILNSIKTENSSNTLRQRKASIDIVPTKTQTHSSTRSTPKHTKLDYKSYAVNRSVRKNEVLQRMRHIKKQIFKSIETSEELIKFKCNKSTANKPQRKEQLIVENVQILPNFKTELLTPQINPFDNFKKPLKDNINSALGHISPKNLNDDEKQAKKSSHMVASNSPINDDEKLMKKSLKRPATSPLLDNEKQVKRLHKSPTLKRNEDEEIKSTDLEATQLDLSESVVEFLQHDLKNNRLNVESFLSEDLPTVEDKSPNKISIESNENINKTEKKDEESANNNILDELLNQVDNEQKTKKNIDVHQKEVPYHTANGNKKTNDFDETKDLNLLNKLGLQIIKTPDIENLIPLEEAEDMKNKAKKFADIYKTWQRIWSSKNGENPKIRQELAISFKQLLTQINLTFKLDLNINELKRLVNLITLWYGQNFNSKLIEKKKISEATNSYLLLFHYIPKTAKRFLYCEYCEEYFSTEHRYYTHRIVHTGALYPYQCLKCTQGFRTLKPCRAHEMQCSYIKMTISHKCTFCTEKFETPAQLYEHSKTHLKTVYNCVKCDLAFASAADVQKHMTLCNRNVKRIPKQLTPRPPKIKVET